jgi:hypothetical protein
MDENVFQGILPHGHFIDFKPVFFDAVGDFRYQLNHIFGLDHQGDTA